MLLEFRVRNYRSFKDETVLSMLAASDRTLDAANTVATSIPSLPKVLRSAVIYGANASGKTNLVRALQLMRGVVVESAALQPNQLFNVQPFRLDEGSASEPTLFEVSLIIEGARYQYGFEFTPDRIRSEWLLVYQKAKPQRWFDRKVVDGKDVYEFGSHLLGPKRVWQDATRPNALFLSTAVQLNSDLLAPLHRWFAESLVTFLDGGTLPFDFSTRMLQNPTEAARIESMLRAADIAFTSISAEPAKGFMHSFKIEAGQVVADAKIEENEIVVPKFTHTVGTVTAEFDFGDESQGTQKLFSLSGPLFDILAYGRVLVIDELDRSLHPLLVRQIIQTFQDPELNARGAQLIFTTHDTAQLDSKILRRDQIWLAEKRHHSQMSELVPLMEFAPRKDEALERNYLGGRYGGVPILARRLVGGTAGAER